MIPILYDSTETTFTSNGLGRLAECTVCVVTEERNGEFECEFTYPITGKHFADIEEGRIISCTHDDDGDRQPFVIYRRSAPIDGLVTFNARHISYRLSNIILEPFTASGITATLSALSTYSINPNPFSFTTDKTTLADYALDRPASIRSIMGGEEGSLLDVYGGEYEFDKFTVKLWAARGHDSGVTIRYGKNLTDITQVIDAGGIYNAVVPYWYQEEEGTVVLVTLPEKIVTAAGVLDPVPVVLDLSGNFPDQPTEADLRQAAEDFLANNSPWFPTENITVNFVQLWNTTEYAGVANLQKVRLCDTVSVSYPALGVTVSGVKVIKTVYNVLSDRYDVVELGAPMASFADTITAGIDKKVEQAAEESRGFLADAIAHATDLITGADGGHVVIVRDANGEPQEILIMDTASLLTATNILRINQNGIGFSTDGGTTYSTAWTIDGQLVADFITAGTLKAIQLQGPTPYSFWDLSSGVFQSYGVKEVTANWYGTQTSYNVTSKTRIDAGELTVDGRKEGGAEDTTFADVGVLANSNYSMYGGALVYPLAEEPPRDYKFPRGEIILKGEKQAIPCGQGSTEESDLWETDGKGFPAARFSTERIEIGLVEDYQRDDEQSIGQNMPQRNTLTLAGGFNGYKKAIVFTQRYNTYYDYDSNFYKTYYNPADPRAVSWEYIPGDFCNYGYWYGGAIFTNSRADFRFTLPLARPISDEVTTIEVDGAVVRAWVNGTTVVSGSVSPDTVSVESWNEHGIVCAFRKTGGWSSSGTNNSAAALQLGDIVITFK